MTPSEDLTSDVLVIGGGPSGAVVSHTLATRGLDALDDYFARYLPQLVLAVLVPVAVLVVVADADWISAVVIAVTLPLIPLFMALVGMHTRARTDRRAQAHGRGGRRDDADGGSASGRSGARGRTGCTPGSVLRVGCPGTQRRPSV